jgi:hypothetical protein
MAVIMTWTLTRGPVHERKVATVVEGNQGDPRLAGGVVEGKVAGGARHGAAPLTVDGDQPDPGRLEPAEDLFRLLGGRGGDRPGGRPYGLGRGLQLADELVGVGAGRDPPRSGETAVADDVDGAPRSRS